jgi:hypothetical protein
MTLVNDEQKTTYQEMLGSPVVLRREEAVKAPRRPTPHDW